MAFFVAYINLFLDAKKSSIQSKVLFSTFKQIIINSYNCMMIWKNWINNQISIDLIMANMQIMKRKKGKAQTRQDQEISLL